MHLLSIIQKIKEINLRVLRSKTYIFMFHQVNDDRYSWKDKDCAISYKSFRNFVDEIIKKGINVCNLRDDLEALKKNGNTDMRAFITFDDAYSDVYYNCFPILKEKALPFTVFLAEGLIGTKGYLEDYMIREMIDSGLCIVGSHTVNHLMLRKQTEDVVNWEMTESKRRLEERFSVNIDLLAYPYGSIYACSRQNIKSARKAGYRLAFSTLNGSLPRRFDRWRYFIPRINVNEKICEKILEKI